MRPFPLMLFAAGFGTRMGGLTATRPKPLLPVAGKPLLDHALDIADRAGVTDMVINLHYLGAQIAAHLARRNIGLSWESEQILETGGGLKAALPLLGAGPVMALNTDAVWTGANPLTQLMAAWDAEKMDALLLLLPADLAMGHNGSGDFLLAGDGQITRANGAAGPVYLGALIIQPSAVLAIPEPVFSLNRPWDDLIAKGRAYGVIHQGGWCDVGSPEGIQTAEALLAAADV